MPTSTWYDSPRSTLVTRLPRVRASQRDTLALGLVGSTQRGSAQRGAIARAMPLDTTRDGKAQRLRRLLDNERITQVDHDQPIAKAALPELKGQRVNPLLDRVLLRDHHHMLVVRIGLRRAIPLTWNARAHRGASRLADQQALLAQALARLPEGVRVAIHGASEFRSQTLFHWLREQGHDVLRGVTGGTTVYDQPAAAASGMPLAACVGTRTSVVDLTHVYVTQERHGPVKVLAWGDKDDAGQPRIRASMTNVPATRRTYRRGKRRMWIETVWRDGQSGGLHLERRGMIDRDRLERRWLPLVIASLWLVSLDRWVVKRGYRSLIDDGASRMWHDSLLQLGVGWKEQLHSYTQMIPVLLYIYT
jgi:hypothetical protein